MPPKKKTPARKGTARVKRGSSSPKVEAVEEPPSTFDLWVDGKSQIICNLDIHMFTLDDHSDTLMKKLTQICEDEADKIVLLLRKRIRAKSKKLDLGCRVI